MQEIWLQFLGQEDPLEKGVATHSSILAWEISGQRSLVGCSPWGRKESDTTEWLSPHTPVSLHELRLFQIGSFAQQLQRSMCWTVEDMARVLYSSPRKWIQIMSSECKWCGRKFWLQEAVFSKIVSSDEILTHFTSHTYLLRVRCWAGESFFGRGYMAARGQESHGSPQTVISKALQRVER